MTVPGVPHEEIRAELAPLRTQIDQYPIVDFEAFVELVSRITSREDRAYLLGAIARGPSWGLHIEPGDPGEALWFRAIGYADFPRLRQELTECAEPLRDRGFDPERLAWFLTTYPEHEQKRLLRLALTEPRERFIASARPKRYTQQDNLFETVFLSDPELDAQPRGLDAPAAGE